MTKREFGIKKGTSYNAIIGLGLILVSIILIIWFFTKGQVTVLGEYAEATKYKTMLCMVDGVSYPFFETESEKKHTEINIAFNGNNFKSISLKHTLYYDNEQSVKDSEAINRGAMGVILGKNGMEADAFFAGYSMQDDRLIYSIYADANDFTVNSSKYFLADGLKASSPFMAFEKIFNETGFECTISE